MRCTSLYQWEALAGLLGCVAETIDDRRRGGLLVGVECVYRHGPMDQHQGHEQAVVKVSFAATLELLRRARLLTIPLAS